jgi:hypothetical protein
MTLASRKPWSLQNWIQAHPFHGRALDLKESLRNLLLKLRQLEIIPSLVQIVLPWFLRNRLAQFSTGCDFPAGQFLIDLDLQILQNNLNQAAVKRPHRFLGQAAHPLRSPILLQVLAIMGKGLQLPTTCRTQGQTLLFAGTVIKEAT